MIPALFAAVASMVVAIVAFIAVVSHQEWTIGIGD
jgi:hypothetical protein